MLSRAFQNKKKSIIFHDEELELLITLILGANSLRTSIRK